MQGEFHAQLDERVSAEMTDQHFPFFYISLTTTWLLLRLGFSKRVYTYELNSPVFSHNEYARSLFFYMNDLNCKEDEETVKNTLDKLFHKATMQDVNLTILIACDKYDLYQPFI